MPAMALSRVAARAVESGPDGENLAPGAWQRLEALPDPRSPQGRIYPLACLIAVAVCAFTAAGNDRFTAVGQWIKRASQAVCTRRRQLPALPLPAAVPTGYGPCAESPASDLPWRLAAGDCLMGVQLGLMGVQLGGMVIRAGWRGAAAVRELPGSRGRLSPCFLGDQAQ